MRLRSLTINGFRGFSREATFDLNADAVVFVGPNGAGKTSLFDALLWALCGRVDRVRGGDSALVSLFSDTGRVEVSVTIGEDSEDLRVTRVFDGKSTVVTVEGPDGVLRGPAALARLSRALWPDAAETTDVVEAMSLALTRSTYLQQDLVSDFISADSDDKRFLVISELFGAGRVADLQGQLDRERTAWARSRGEREAELTAARARIVLSEQRLERLGDSASLGDASALWDVWWERARPFGDVAPPPRLASTESDEALDEAMQMLRSVERELSRALREVDGLLDRADRRPGNEERYEQVLAETAQVERELPGARAKLEALQKQAARDRLRQVNTQEEREELSALASLALRHIDGDCPVCGQEHDREQTRQRLEVMMGDASDAGSTDRTGEAVDAAARAVAQLEERRAEVAAELRYLESERLEAEASRREIAAGLERLTLDVHDGETVIERLERARDGVTTELSEVADLLRSGEQLALRITRASEAAQRAEVEALLARQRAEAEEIEDDLRRRDETYDLAVVLLEALRGATTEVVKSELKRLAPVLQQVFAMIDPHPALRAVSLVGGFANRKGRVDAVLSDPNSGQSTRNPENVLSSSQLNGLAVAVFLALNLGVRNIPLRAVVLDDPLQSLDDLNLLGLTDLLRRIKEHRQILISTHDPRFAELLERKLRALDSDLPTITYRFESWTRTGPVYEQVRREPEPTRFRLVGPAA